MEEIKPDEMTDFYNTVRQLGNVYINDAFGSAHKIILVLMVSIMKQKDMDTQYKRN